MLGQDLAEHLAVVLGQEDALGDHVVADPRAVAHGQKQLVPGIRELNVDLVDVPLLVPLPDHLGTEIP
ncbi:hypothetical protein [Blastococcus aggregatus]|uniref:hypothetical protein n=1 Tax=Blastococcus aggregatus TaxID=38502 RepID=UPI000BE47E8D|nr:hypothetical protein [Blastococcus aggregatus]